MADPLFSQRLSLTNERVMGSIPFLPPEIHLVLAQHIHRDDLLSYRLASRLLSEIGKSELFKTITLRNTLASVSRLKHIIETPHLSQLVRTLIWDVNAWRVGPDARDWHEWTRYCKDQASIAKPRKAALYLELAASRQHWEAYLSHLEDEKAAIQEIQSLFTRDGSSTIPEGKFADLKLPNLSKTYILKGTSFRLQNGYACCLRGHSKQETGLPVIRSLTTWRGDSLQNTMSQRLLSAIFAVAVSVRKLRTEGLTIEDHTRLWMCTTQSLPKTTSIRIRCGVSSSTQYSGQSHAILHNLFSQLPNLESLHFDLRTRYQVGNTGPRCSIRTVQDMFGFEGANAQEPGVTDVLVTWPKLRKLALGYFDSSSAALLSLLTRHSATLRDLRFQAVNLNDIGSAEQISWQDIFAAIGKPPVLEKVRMRALCRIHLRPDGTWAYNFDEATNAAGDWILNVLNLPEGKHCTSQK